MDISEKIKEISATAHMIGIAVEYEDNKELIQDSIINLVRDLDNVVKEIDENPAFTDRL